MPDDPNPPIAPQRPVTFTHHGDSRVDPWAWMRDRDDPEVIEHLVSENAYALSAMDHTVGLQEAVYDEIKSRVQETDFSPPVRNGNWDYFTRSFEANQYVVHCRRPPGAEPGVDEIVLLDENELALGHDYFALGGFCVSPDGLLIAYITDTTGGERYRLHFRDVETATDLADDIDDLYYGLSWAADNRTIFYVRPDDAVRPYQVWRHVIGTPPSDDVLVYEEPDEHFFISLTRSRSGKYVFIAAESKTTSEVRALSTDEPHGTPFLIAPRQADVEYSIEHHHGPDGNRFFILTNASGARDFCVMVADVATPGREQWKQFVGHALGTRIDAIDLFARHLVISERRDGLERLRVIRFADNTDHEIQMPDPVYSAWAANNLEFDTDVLRFAYTSLVEPLTAYDENLNDGTRSVVKRTPVRGDFNQSDYVSTRLMATASDGTQIPMSVVHRADCELDGTAPALLYGYGSYEISSDPTFSIARLSLLDRGFVFAIAHIRGGGEMGREWYEQGRLMFKRNTFTDFISCAEHLIAKGYTNAGRLGARGGSAGGLLMGAVVNARPDLFRAAVAQVPFVDCLSTILDPSLPLTITEWEEWGNPLEDPDAYAYLKSYSPYDNIHDGEYPALLVTAGLNDPRVAFWEPAKWVAKLREHKTDDRLVLLKTEMGAGHGGPSGRYDAWRDEALTLAFLIDQLTGENT